MRPYAYLEEALPERSSWRRAVISDVVELCPLLSCFSLLDESDGRQPLNIPETSEKWSPLGRRCRSFERSHFYAVQRDSAPRFGSFRDLLAWLVLDRSTRSERGLANNGMFRLFWPAAAGFPL